MIISFENLHPFRYEVSAGPMGASAKPVEIAGDRGLFIVPFMLTYRPHTDQQYPAKCHSIGRVNNGFLSHFGVKEVSFSVRQAAAALHIPALLRHFLALCLNSLCC
jgi:hypothetical protein